MNTLELTKNIIKNRYSLYVKQMSGGLIPHEDIAELLSLAHRAPTHKLTQPWHFIVFSGPALHKLVDFQRTLFLEKQTGEPNEKKLEKFTLTQERVSHIVAVVCNFSRQLPEIEEVCAVSCAVENFWIGLCAAGYGGYWSTGNGTFDSATRRWLGLQENQQLLGFFYCGVPVPELAYSPSLRGDLESHITWYTS